MDPLAMRMIERARFEADRIDRVLWHLFWDEDFNIDPLEPWMDYEEE